MASFASKPAAAAAPIVKKTPAKPAIKPLAAGQPTHAFVSYIEISQAAPGQKYKVTAKNFKVPVLQIFDKRIVLEETPQEPAPLNSAGAWAPRHIAPDLLGPQVRLTEPGLCIVRSVQFAQGKHTEKSVAAGARALLEQQIRATLMRYQAMCDALTTPK